MGENRVPVMYQYRMRATWLSQDAWMPWEECSAEAAANYKRLKVLHDWEYQSRALVELIDEDCQVQGLAIFQQPAPVTDNN